MLDLLAAETTQPGIGSAWLISHLYESLFLYAVRAYASSHAAPQKGWLAAMSDRHLSKAIEAMHSGLDESWSVESLAREARMSRSAFALKFKAILGKTPLGYLTQWRMYRAAALLRANNTSLSEVAAAVGYQSEISFSRVFRREMGLAPREYRRKCSVENNRITPGLTLLSPDLSSDGVGPKSDPSCESINVQGPTMVNTGFETEIASEGVE